MTAQYLLRFDDLCPTMDRARWRRFMPLIRRFGIRPILAVVPDNQDLELQHEPHDPRFWGEMRSLEAEGATIGLHGFQHLCRARGRGLVPVHDRTEFAGVRRDLQREWVGAGLGILRGQGLHPRIWVGPRHGLDRVTLGVLREEGIELISDGFAARPFRRGGLTWIPQQLWGPMEKRSGLWTICMHVNSATDEAVAEMGDFLGRFSSQFTSVDRVVREWPIVGRSVGDRVFHARAMMRMRLARIRRRLRDR
jgi:predicted deacetylase